ncbi:hypothetical protein RND81_04G027000 [Saponaria officinalis]|uniref:ATP-dependent DNA helicase n=1 Tax=Saponaria officinalis TaxID=3572 RepID=A0AAW1LC91_SAPOF
MSQISSEMYPDVLRLLMRLMETNPYARFFRSLRDLDVQEWNRIVIRSDPTHDQHTHNAPTASQVAGIWVEDAPADSPLTQDIVVYARSGASHRILHHYGCYDPLQYPILFSYCETGCHRCIYRRNVRRRPNQQVESFPINEVLVQTVDDLLYSEEQAFYNAGETRSSNIGYRLILPATFLGCGRDMHCRYLNSMGLVQRFGKPNIFLTITCNPRWPEIERELLPFEEVQNRPDLIARIFRSKLIELKKDIVEKQLFGKVAGYVYVIEFQKRGLPHAHFLIILHSEHKIRNPESYDMHVCEEIPDEDRFPHLHAAVLKHMMHGPCGRNFPTNPCMRDRKCKNHYPREFSQFTTNGRNSYPIYRRRNDGKAANVRGAQLDNRWIVPYNPFLLAKYDCHLNVEVCSTVKAVKYLYKYVYKGHDRVSFALTETDSPTAIDEISTYQSARWVSPPEAAWRIFRLCLNEIHPNIVVLKVHLPNMQTVTFRPHERLQNIADDDNRKTTIEPLSFDDLLTVNDLRCTTFREAAYRRDLLEADNSIEKCLEEASQYQLPFVLRRLFATLLIYCQPKNPRDLLDKFYSHLSEDFAVTFSSNPRKVFIMTLKSISSIIESIGKSFDSFDFGGLTVDEDTEDHRRMKEIEEEINIPVTADDIEAVKLLNSEQRIAYNLIYDSVMRCQSSSGIAALNITGGRTTNSRFKIPLDTEEHLSNQTPKQSGLAELIRACRLIIWDEASMAKRQTIEHFERTLRDICSCDTVFGGKIIVFGGDFRRVLPVIPKSTLQKAVNASFVLSPLRPTLTKLHLTVNMRAIHDPGFSDFALKVGNGSPPFENGEDIMLPRHILISADQNCSLMDKLISSVYPDISLINLDLFRTTKKSYLDSKK